jgi:hypothetical protein
VMRSDIEAAIKYLQGIDIRQELPPGVERMHRYVIELDGKSFEPYSLKSSFVSDLPNDSRRMHKTRILFCLPSDEEVVIYGITSRDELNTFHKNKGFGTLRRGQ